MTRSRIVAFSLALMLAVLFGGGLWFIWKFRLSENTPVFSACTGFGGIVLGALVSFFPTYWIERLKKEENSKAVTGAVVTEIKALLFLIETRGYAEHVGAILKDLRSGSKEWATFQIMVSDDYRPVYRSHLGQIGLLPSRIRDDVVAFHQLVDAILCDVRPGGLMNTRQCGVREFEQLNDILVEAILVGRRVVNAYPCWSE